MNSEFTYIVTQYQGGRLVHVQILTDGPETDHLAYCAANSDIKIRVDVETIYTATGSYGGKISLSRKSWDEPVHFEVSPA